MTQERNLHRACELEVGQIVRSKAGRDKGDVFIVLDVLDAKRVAIVDGKSRKLDRPKVKRVIHLQRYNTVIENFRALMAGQEFHDAMIRKLLKPYQDDEEDNHVR